MRLSPFLAPRSENLDKKKFIIKKILSTIVATAAMSIAMPDTALDLPSTVNEVVPVTRFGLSRQRPAFRKAVSMLKEAAPENPRLADYYERVTRRVKDDGAEGEENEDGVAAIVVHKNNPAGTRAPGVEPSTASLAQPASQSLIPVAQASVITEPIPQASYSTGGDSRSQTDETLERPQLAVGDVDFETNAAIERWMNYYSASPIGRSTLKIGFERSSLYLEMARAEFRSAGVPEDLVWLAFVESVWNPRAASPAAAGGLWQFIPSTATEYGLRVENGIDERADPFKQTRVAAVYLHDLYTIFGDWPLAMAAYNSGEPRVMGAIVKNGNANFWELYAKQLLPKETCDYVPKILAAIKLANSAEDYGLVPYSDTAVSAGD